MTGGPRLVGQLYAATGNLADALDCVQEAFVQVASIRAAFTSWAVVVDNCNRVDMGPVAILRDVAITIDGAVGYYAGGMSDGVRLTIRGSAGWGVAECMLSGTVVVTTSLSPLYV